MIDIKKRQPKIGQKCRFKYSIWRYLVNTGTDIGEGIYKGEDDIDFGHDYDDHYREVTHWEEV